MATAVLSVTGVLTFLRDTLFTYRAARQQVARQEQREARADAQTTSGVVVKEALELVTTLSAQVKDLRSEHSSAAEGLRREIGALRTRIRELEARLAEVEAELEAERGENIHLKALLYDQQQQWHADTPHGSSARAAAPVTHLRPAGVRPKAPTTRPMGGRPTTRPSRRTVRPPDEGA